MAIGFMVLLSILISSITASMIAGQSTVQPLPDKMVLSLTLEGEFPDYSTPSPYSLVMKSHFRHFINAIDRAQTDHRVKGLLLSGGNASLSLAQMQELRSALRRFRASGKTVWFYAESMDAGLGSYYLAAAVDQIWMQPVGSLAIGGLRAEMPYARRLLDKLGIEPQFFARKEYKDVFSSFSESGMNEHTRESVTRILNDISGIMVADIEADRKLAAGVFKTHMDKAVLTDREALQAGLIDRLDYFDVLKKDIRIKITGYDDPKAMKFVRMTRYMDDANHHALQADLGVRAHKIALVYAVGAIVSDDDVALSSSAYYGGSMVSAKDLAKEIEEAALKDDIKAIVVRVDSPGGSPTASETIRRALAFAQQNGKKVVVSMGGTAASGGYWIAASADRIYAMPMTITGSIGVAGGKFVLADLWEKVGVNWGEIQIGANADLYSPNQPYSEEGRARMNAMMDSIYEAFIVRVAQGRKMPVAKVDEVARGRVWTGHAAMGLGLVDEMGTLNDALDYAAILAGLRSRRDVDIVEIPREKTPFEKLVELLEMQARIGEGLSAQAVLGEWLVPLVASYNNAGFMTRENLNLQ
ncbi:MAG: signal peptide peptidase SppA [Micavibrio aeruginosavorus]|uniref:Signal peptide peptidase SppA n=1 Tax=Micavibrio aeruginosavorus TaxID=349221 RepID=A0A7T5R415_9BACT|nr:MAG: signal peptide peptidase SppA [Micavibrio aeruginosavorus]